MMPKILTLAILLASSGLSFAAAEELMPIAAVLKNKRAFDGTNFCIQGKTSVLFEKYSRRGNHYFSVWVSEGAAKIKVFYFGFPNFKEGDIIEACGLFLREKWVSGRVFHDEFTAQAILTGGSMQAGLVTVSTAGVQAVPGALAVTPNKPDKPTK